MLAPPGRQLPLPDRFKVCGDVESTRALDGLARQHMLRRRLDHPCVRRAGVRQCKQPALKGGGLQ